MRMPAVIFNEVNYADPVSQLTLIFLYDCLEDFVPV